MRSFYNDPVDFFNCKGPWIHGFLKEVEGRASRFGWCDAILEIPNDITNPLGGTKKLTQVDNLQGVPPTGGEGETVVTP